MITLEDFLLEEENVQYLEEGMTYQEVIGALAHSCSASFDGKVLEVVEKALERERLVSTAIGSGIAIPHARVPFLEKFSLAIGIIKGGTSWEAIDGEPVRIVCLIAGPEGAPTAYLSFLSYITSLLKEEEVRRKILFSDSKKNIVNIFRSC